MRGARGMARDVAEGAAAGEGAAVHGAGCITKRAHAGGCRHAAAAEQSGFGAAADEDAGTKAVMLDAIGRQGRRCRASRLGGENGIDGTR